MTDAVRLHKLLARRGVASLRASERLIAEGRVSVNGQVVTTPGTVAEPDDEIRVDGKLVGADRGYRYLLLNKPPDIISTARDELNRLTVLDLVDAEERLYPVGRLDRESEGLMLLTNDGELAERMMHPRYGVHRRYHVEVNGGFTDADLARLRRGVVLEDGLSKPLSARVLRRSAERSTLEIVLGEGRNRQVRRTLEGMGKEVRRLTRVALGPLALDGLKTGRHRELTLDEARLLRRAVGLDEGDAG